MEVARTQRGSVDVLTVTGPIYAEDNDEFVEVMGRLRRGGRFRVVIDARELEYANSRAVATLVSFSRDARLGGGRLVLVRPNATVSKILAAVGLLALVPTYETLDEAVAACGQEGDRA